VTMRGSFASHAASLARAMGKPMITGAQGWGLNVDVNAMTLFTTLHTNNGVFKNGDIITIDGSSGNLYKGHIPMASPPETSSFNTLMRFLTMYKRMGVLANADHLNHLRQAMQFDCDGIGLFCTEFMFQSPNVLEAIRNMFLCSSSTERLQYLQQVWIEAISIVSISFCIRFFHFSSSSS
jgi:pyruvate, orthophosphate dikinase